MYEMSWLALFIRKAHLPLLYSSPLNVTSLIKHPLKYQLASFFSPDTVKKKLVLFRDLECGGSTLIQF